MEVEDPPATALKGLSWDHFFATPVVEGTQTPVLIDKDGDAEIILAAGATLTELNLATDANAKLGIKLTPGKVELSTAELGEGTEIKIDGVSIGHVAYYENQFFTFEFKEATTPE